MKMIAISQALSHRIPGAIVAPSVIVASSGIVASCGIVASSAIAAPNAITAFPAKAISVEYVQ